MNESDELRALRLHQIVEHIRQFDDFPFDVDDVRYDLDSVLFFYGFGPVLSNDDRVILVGELVRFAEASEVGESRRIMSQREVGQWLCLGNGRG